MPLAHSDIKRRYAAGETLASIAASYGVSRQRVHQVLAKVEGRQPGHTARKMRDQTMADILTRTPGLSLPQALDAFRAAKCARVGPGVALKVASLIGYTFAPLPVSASRAALLAQRKARYDQLAADWNAGVPPDVLLRRYGISSRVMLYVNVLRLRRAGYTMMDRRTQPSRAKGMQ